MNDQIGSVGPWAREKLDLLGSYLVEYAKILRKQNFRGYVYIDAFAGAGIHHVRNQKPARDDLLQLQLFDTTHLQDDSEYQEFISGSPRVALELPYEFTYYVFVDTDPQRIQELESLKREFPSKPIRIHRKNCNEYLRELLIDPRINWKEWRAVVFLDPFGMQVPWSTIESLAQTNSIEIIVNFPVGMAIQRLLRKDGTFTTQQRWKLDEYFGSEAWYEILYKPQPDLFGEPIEKIEASGKSLVDWYCSSRLRSCFKFVTKARLIRNSRRGHLYYLIHAGPNETGHRIANHILGKM